MTDGSDQTADLFCLMAVSFGMLGLLLAVRAYFGAEHGWDFLVYCDATVAFHRGVDPYLVENLGRSRLPFVYPPVTIHAFRVLCLPNRVLSPDVTYGLLWVLALLGAGVVLYAADETPKPVYLGTILVAGFGSLFWNVRTGNIGLLSLLLFSFVYYFLDRPLIAAVPLGAASVFKLYPAAIAGLFVLNGDRSLGDRLGPAVVTTAAVVGVMATSRLLYPSLFETYVLSLRGQLPQPSPAKELGGVSTPSLPFFIRDLSLQYAGSEAVFLILYALYALAVALSFVAIVRLTDPEFRRLFSFGVLAYLLVLPRLKPYSLVLALPPVYFLSRDLDHRHRAWTLVTVVLLPYLAVELQPARLPYPSGPLWFLLTRIVAYGQSLSLLLVYCLLVWTTLVDAQVDADRLRGLLGRVPAAARFHR